MKIYCKRPRVVRDDTALSLAGAEELKRKIESYWQAKGFNPPAVKLHIARPSSDFQRGRVDIRSDMLNGRPPQ